MKSLFSLGMAAFLLAFIFSADLAAGMKETEKMLIKQGWVRLTAKQLKALRHVTLYGLESYIVYINSSGTRQIFRLVGNTLKGTREITEDGKACVQYENGRYRCHFFWKRGEVLLQVRPDGLINAEFTMQPGNPENL